MNHKLLTGVMVGALMAVGLVAAGPFAPYPVGAAQGSPSPAPMENFRMIDAHGEMASVAVDGKNTLILFYRGDW